jgi:ATP/maltotriose-dependent transcriptional regulator MalT
LLGWALAEASLAATACGLLDPAEARLERATAVARDAHAPQLDLVVHDARASLRRGQGRHDDALAERRRALAIVEATGAEGLAAWVAATHGSVLLELGAAGDAARELEGGLGRAEHMGAVADAVRCAGLLAWARHLAGDEGGARAAADRTEALLAQATLPPGGAFLFGGQAIAGLARVRLAQGDAAHAARIAEPLLAAAERSGWREASALAALVLDDARQRSGQNTS